MIEIDTLWNFSDPEATERAFLELRSELAHRPPQMAELLTQIARARGLQRRFEEAHATLDEAHDLLEPGSRAQVRYWLERGRVFRSSGHPEQAKLLFVHAFELGSSLGEDALSIDAAHMVALVEPGEASLEWNDWALGLARTSQDARAQGWKASLLNNIAASLHDAGRFGEALEMFEETVTLHQGNVDQHAIVRWNAARVMRSLGRFDDALAIQRELLEQFDARGQTDGYVHEEIAENLLALENPVRAVPHFAQVHASLSRDPWFCESEPVRLERLRQFSKPQGARSKVPR